MITPMNIEFWMLRINPLTGAVYTKNEASLHIKSFRKSSPLYWIKRGYTQELARQAVVAHQKEMSARANKKLKGAKNRTNTQVGWWVDRGYTVEEARERISRRQSTFSLDKCIERYGDEGERIWRERQVKWQRTLRAKSVCERGRIDKLKGHSLKLSIDKFGVEGGISAYIKYRISRGADPYIIKKTINYVVDRKCYELFNDIYHKFYIAILKKRGKASRESLHYIIPIYKFCRKELGISRQDIMIGITGSKEYYIKHKRRSGGYFCDMCILGHKIIIEYNNIAWHPDPTIMNKEAWDHWSHPMGKYTNVSKYKIDADKLVYYNELGFKVYVLWNVLNYDKQINNIKEWLRKINEDYNRSNK